MGWLIPSRKQWRNWKAPTKLAWLSTWIALLGLPIALIAILLSIPSSSPPPASLAQLNVDTLKINTSEEGLIELLDHRMDVIQSVVKDSMAGKVLDSLHLKNIDAIRKGEYIKSHEISRDINDEVRIFLTESDRVRVSLTDGGFGVATGGGITPHGITPRGSTSTQPIPVYGTIEKWVELNMVADTTLPHWLEQWELRGSSSSYVLKIDSVIIVPGGEYAIYHPHNAQLKVADFRIPNDDAIESVSETYRLKITEIHNTIRPKAEISFLYDVQGKTGKLSLNVPRKMVIQPPEKW